MRLVALANERYTFHLADTGEPFAMPIVGPPVVRMLRGGKLSLRAELAKLYVQRDTNRVPAASAIADAMLVLEGQAAEAGEVPLHIRVADHHGAHYLDLGSQSGQCVRIADGGWSLLSSLPDGLYFRRSALISPLPTPSKGNADLNQLWEFVPVAKEDRPLIVAWLVQALLERQPHPILSLAGEQGTGKTTCALMLVSLIDPSPAPVRKPPRDQEAWISAAGGSWAIAFDNVSAIPDWLSDSLCRASTGEGDVRRKLYTDGDHVVFAFRRVIILTSIDVGAVRADLGERLLHVQLTEIDPKARKLDAELARRWAEARPQLFVALLNAAARVINRLALTSRVGLPRMADYATVLAAVDDEWGSDGFTTYLGRLRDQLADSISSDPFIAKLADAATESVSTRTGAAWLAMCQPHPGTDEAKTWRAPKGWPSNGREVTRLLHRNAPAMRKVGWHVQDLGSDNHDGVIQWAIGRPNQNGSQ
jgi:hypothetical protein